MNKQITSKEALKIWAEYSPLPKGHLSAQKLYQFSLEEGLQKAKNIEINHLSLCPKCLNAWKTLCDLTGSTKADDYYEKEGHSILSFGVLQAASSKITGALSVKSACGKFVLGIFPEVDNPKKAMIVLETEDDARTYQGMIANVRDSKNNIIMDAQIKHGRAAVKIDNLDAIDLSTWSIILSKSSDKGTNE
jgi:hypothetical protein